MLSALFRAAFSIRKFLRNELRRSLSRAARRIGPLAAEGARGHGMDDPLVGMAKAPLKTLIEGWARHGQENYYAPTAGAEETGGRGLATTHTGKGCVMAN